MDHHSWRLVCRLVIFTCGESGGGPMDASSFLLCFWARWQAVFMCDSAHCWGTNFIGNCQPLWGALDKPKCFLGWGIYFIVRNHSFPAEWMPLPQPLLWCCGWMDYYLHFCIFFPSWTITTLTVSVESKMHASPTGMKIGDQTSYNACTWDWELGDSANELALGEGRPVVVLIQHHYFYGGGILESLSAGWQRKGFQLHTDKTDKC